MQVSQATIDSWLEWIESKGWHHWRDQYGNWLAGRTYGAEEVKAPTAAHLLDAVTDRLEAKEYDCTCHHTCQADSMSGRWHQHEDEPCPVHPGAEMVG